MSQFTPLFDEITKQRGIITAAIYGYIWRKCQMDKGICNASFQTMADDLNVSRRTIITHVKLLVKYSLITDLTPNADRKPHEYLVNEIHQTGEIAALEENETRELNAPAREIDSPELGQEIHQTREIDSPKDTIQEKIIIIKEHFQNLTGLFPNQYSYTKDWEPVFKVWADLHGDKSLRMMDTAVDIARGNNENGTRYKITSPRSLAGIMANITTPNGNHDTVKQANDAAGGVYV